MTQKEWLFRVLSPELKVLSKMVEMGLDTKKKGLMLTQDSGLRTQDLGLRT